MYSSPVCPVGHIACYFALLLSSDWDQSLHDPHDPPTVAIPLCRFVPLLTMSLSLANFQRQLCSAHHDHRQTAIEALTQSFSSPQTPDLTGLAALLRTVSQIDPHPTVRLAATKSRFFPSTALALPLFDSDSNVRLYAAQRCASTDQRDPSALLKPLLQLLAVESDEKVLLAILQAVTSILNSRKGLMSVDALLDMLGCTSLEPKESKGLFSGRESYAVIRDMAEHDSSYVRAAVRHVLVAIAVRGSAVASGEARDRVMSACFELFELLVQDTDAEVQTSAVETLVKSPLADQWKENGVKVRLSEKTVICVIRMLTRFIALKDLGEKEVSALASLLTCPLRTLSGYGLIETFLRRHLSLARTADIESQSNLQTQKSIDMLTPKGMPSNASKVHFLEHALRSLVNTNRDFVRVYDLTRTHSDKYSRFQGLNV